MVAKKRAPAGGAGSADVVGGSPAPDEKKRRLVAARAKHNIEENLKTCCPMGTDVTLDPQSLLTLRQRVERDVLARMDGGCGWQKLYIYLY